MHANPTVEVDQKVDLNPSASLPPAALREELLGGSAPAGLRVDFAAMFHDHLLVYGWILGLRHWVARAEIRYGGAVIDLTSVALPVPRADVTQHFAAQIKAEDDHHGFCLLVALPDSGTRPGYLRLSVSLHTGETFDRVWPVSIGDAGVLEVLQKNRPVLTWMLQHLPAPDAALLGELWEAMAPAASKERDLVQALQLQFGVDVCVLLDGRLLVALGWLNDRDQRLTAASARVADATIDFLKGLQLARPGGDANVRHTVRGEVVPQVAFSWVHPLPPSVGEFTEVVFEVCAGARQMYVRRRLSAHPVDARGDLSRTFHRMGADAAIGLIERIAGALDDSSGARATFDWLAAVHTQAVERLPSLIPTPEMPRCALHVDAAIPIADKGVFLSGWFHAGPGAVKQIACHAGLENRRIDDTWFRASRLDVTTHLNSLEIASSTHEHGFACFVPLPNPHASYFVAITLSDGTVRRVRLPKAPPSTALETVRAVLTTFNATVRGLRPFLDRHVGPAVQSVWRSRAPEEKPPTLGRFGVPPSSPRVSVIVPLYGRHDLADYQMALFADDPDFAAAELIYFVDDPSIYDDFRSRCEDIYEIHRVPFTVAFAGANLGFAGATNRAASIATADRLLLMNSDVLPKRPGWLGQILTLYESLDETGPLGVKLLYEDGGVQHAGITFRRHAPWDGLWINDHPQKGQSPVGLAGIRRVDAVTAACMLVDTALYRELGGLCEDYIIGDFEDSDFCLRAAAAGRPSWVALDVELYHVERQSQNRIGNAQWRSNLTLYNCWQHDVRWAARIEAQQLEAQQLEAPHLEAQHREAPYAEERQR
jgi:GT2 family glycosyltransferase